MNLLMIRHGEVPSNLKKVYAGRSTERLTEKGVQQARQVSGKLIEYEVDAIYSSPIQRALQTAETIKKTIGLEVIKEDAFREMELGLWEGLSESEIAEKYPEKWQAWLKTPDKLSLPGRETLKELLERVLVGLQNIYQDMADGNVVIVTHVAIIRVLLLWNANKSLALYKTINVPNAEIFEIKIKGLPSF